MLKRYKPVQLDANKNNLTADNTSAINRNPIPDEQDGYVIRSIGCEQSGHSVKGSVSDNGTENIMELSKKIFDDGKGKKVTKAAV